MKKRCDIEAGVKVNPAALSSRRQRVVVSPEVEKALFLLKQKDLEEKFDIPQDKRLSSKGYDLSYGLKEYRHHGEAASANLEDVAGERARLKEINARYKEEDQFNFDESYINPFNAPDRGMATHKLSGRKKNKFRLTLGFACNATGTEKLPLVFIGKSVRPQCFRKKSGKELGFYYRGNKKAWMTICCRWLRMFDSKMRAQNRKVCLHLDNFSGHYTTYEPTNVELIYFKPNLTAWVQPLDAGIIQCFKAHYQRRFFNLLEAMHMARNAWKEVTPEMIRNCWKHADVRRDPIIVRIPQSQTQRGWKILHAFADPSSGMTLPQAEESPLIKALQEESHARSQSFTPAEYTEASIEVASAISELEGRNRTFEGAPTADAYIEPDVEREVGVAPVWTDDEQR